MPPGWSADPGHLPVDEAEEELDLVLARTAAVVAVRRHARPPAPGSSPRPLADVAHVVGSGGVLRHATPRRQHAVLAAVANDHAGGWKVPRSAALSTDSAYLLGAVGLLRRAVPRRGPSARRADCRCPLVDCRDERLAHRPGHAPTRPGRPRLPGPAGAGRVLREDPRLGHRVRRRRLGDAGAARRGHQRRAPRRPRQPGLPEGGGPSSRRPGPRAPGRSSSTSTSPSRTSTTPRRPCSRRERPCTSTSRPSPAASGSTSTPRATRSASAAAPRKTRWGCQTPHLPSTP